MSAIGCGDDSPAVDAGQGDGGASDARSGFDAIPPLLFADFSVTGCSETAQAGEPADAGPPARDAGRIETPCAGPAPLSLTFVAVADAQINAYSWEFGDGGQSAQPSPTHTYTAPGVYDVILSVLGPGGNISVRKPAKIVVTTASAGAPCTANDQCASAECVCGDDADCAPAVEPGFCSTPCSAGAPCADGVCVDLAPTAPSSPEPWQQSLCLIDCSVDETCPAGLACRELRDGAGPGWVRACFALAVPADVGQSCTDETGALNDSVCASGVCLDEGARGLCSAPCSADPCPTYAACATFSGGSPGPSCLARCDPDTSCDLDPFLSCEDPGGAGAKSFTVDEAPANPDGYCAPRRCSAGPDCGPDGTCAGGFCQ